MERQRREERVAVIGAGLVGTLEAILLAQRGYKVQLFEYRQDIRLMDHVPGRSINLAMSARGRSAMAKIGLEEAIIANHGIPMKARMIHSKAGQMTAIPYDKDDKRIYSVGRRFVNEVLLNKADEHPNISIHYEHRLSKLNIQKKEILFNDPSTGETKNYSADLIIGCDGAYSAVRREMMRGERFSYNQQYIPHGYMELCIPPTDTGEFAMPREYLHIWPRGQYMMIALPNQDKSWTVTLFMPFEIFDSLTTPEQLLSFFEENYCDSIPLIGREKLVEDFFANKAQPMISVKCFPYNISDKCLIMGDAAHAMVPFYGQGMNCGMEDCVVLEELMDLYQNDFSRVLPAYSAKRNPDAEAIVELALRNYVEMRDDVNTVSFMVRKKIDNLLYSLFPKTWVPLYTMVTFTREPYHLCIKKREWQDKVLARIGQVLLVGSLAAAVAFLFSTQSANLFDRVKNLCL